MGQITRFNLRTLIEKHGILHFVETGTGEGRGLAHASRFPFKSLHSCEIEPTLAASTTAAFFIDDRIKIQNDASDAFLIDVCRKIPAEEPILFWLDAHFPGADYGIRKYGDEKNELTRLPLKNELVLIKAGRPDSRDIVLVDDLRIWIDGPFGSGNLPEAVRPFCPAERNAEFFRHIFGATHDVQFDYNDEGYVVILPKVAEMAE